MASKRVEDYAYKFKLSNRQAKKRLGKGRNNDSGGAYSQAPERGKAVAGTGKPKGDT